MKRLLAALVLALAAGARGAPPPYHSDDPGTEENFQVIYNQMANHVHDGNGTAPLPAAQLGLAYGDTPYAMIIDEKAQGTPGGTSVVGGPWTRTLNTISTSTISGLTLVTSSITIPAGTYQIKWSAPFYRSNRAKTWVANTAGATVLVNGRTGFNLNSGDYSQSLSSGGGIFTIDSSSTIILRYSLEFAYASYGLGIDGNVGGLTEIYSVVELWKLR